MGRAAANSADLWRRLRQATGIVLARHAPAGGLANGRSLPPKDGDEWRVFFRRFEALRVGGQEVWPHPARAWNAHGVYDTRRPERFTRIRFSEEELAL